MPSPLPANITEPAEIGVQWIETAAGGIKLKQFYIETARTARLLRSWTLVGRRGALGSSSRRRAVAASRWHAAVGRNLLVCLRRRGGRYWSDGRLGRKEALKPWKYRPTLNCGR